MSIAINNPLELLKRGREVGCGPGKGLRVCLQERFVLPESVTKSLSLTSMVCGAVLVRQRRDTEGE